MSPLLRHLWLVALCLALAVSPGRQVLADEGQPAPAAVKQVRTDTYGDPLPPGAVARLGTTRFRHLGRAGLLGFTADATTVLLTDEQGGVRHVDVRTGKTIRHIPLGDDGDEFAGGFRGMRYGQALPVAGDCRTAAIHSRRGEQDVTLVDLLTGKALSHIRTDQLFLLPEKGGPGLNLSNFALHLSHDGKLLLVTGQQSEQGTLVTWIDTTTAKRLHAKSIGAGVSVVNAAVSRDGKTVAALEQNENRFRPDAKYRLRLWDAASGRELHNIELPAGQYLRSFALLASGKSVLTSQDGVRLILLDTATGKDLRRFEPKEQTVFSFTLTPDEASVFVAGGGRIYQWDVATGKQIRVLQFPQPGRQGLQLRLSPDAKVLAASGIHHLTLWDTATGKELHPSAGHVSAVRSVAFVPGTDRLLSATNSGPAIFWDSAAGKELRRLAPANGSQRWDWLEEERDNIPPAVTLCSADGKTLATVFLGHAIELWNSSTGQALRSLGEADSLHVPAFAPGGKLLAAGSIGLGGRDGSARVRIWEVGTGREMRQIIWAKPDNAEKRGAMSSGLVTALAFSTDGRTLAGAGGVADGETFKPEVRLWEASSGQERARLHFSTATGMASPDRFGRRIYRDEDELGGLPESLLFSPDGRTLAVGMRGTVYLWDLTTGKESRQLAGHEMSTRAVAFSPDGNLLAAGKRDGSIRLWRAESGTVLGDFQAHVLPVTALGFSADGKRLASGSADSTILVWDVEQLQEGLGRARRLTPSEATALWTDLGSTDAAKAYQALLALVGSPVEAVVMLKERLRPVPPLDPQRLQRLLAELGDERYPTREKATRELEAVAELARSGLQKLLDNEESAEIRQRAQALLKKLDGSVTLPAQRATVRAIEVLEHIGSAEARQVLQTLSAGAAGHRTTEEARASLERLARRNPSNR